MGSEKFCLRWNDFETNISSAFRELRDDKDFFDVTIACDDEQLQAHKVILSACSPFFRNILRRNPHQHPLLYLKGVKYTDLQSVLNFMYHGEVNVAQEELNSFLAVAEDLRVKGLTQNQSAGTTKKDPPSNLPPVVKNTPRSHDREPVPPPKRSRPIPIPATNTVTPMIQNSVDDEIQEVVPVKSEPRDPPAPAAVPDEELYRPHPQHHVQTSQALTPADDQSLSYPEENYEEYQYGEDQGYEGTMMEEMGMDGNKGLIENFIDVSDCWIRCVMCEKTFTNMQNARRHVRTIHVHNETGMNLLFDVCQQTFAKLRSFDDHMRIKHNIYKKGRYNTDFRGGIQ